MPNRLYPILKDIKPYVPDPYLVLIEGFCVSTKDIDTGQAARRRSPCGNFLVLMGYGLTRFEAPNSPFDCANYWGENHYGGGWNSRLPLAMPQLAYTHYATMTRHLNRANFTKFVTTGSTSPTASSSSTTRPASSSMSVDDPRHTTGQRKVPGHGTLDSSMPMTMS